MFLCLQDRLTAHRKSQAKELVLYQGGGGVGREPGAEGATNPSDRNPIHGSMGEGIEGTGQTGGTGSGFISNPTAPGFIVLEEYWNH